MDTFSRISPEQRANLTAYLDGELDETQTADIERVLSKSAVARNDVELLARTYDLLDQLPKFQVTTAFTERTIATVRLETARPDYTQSAWFQAALRNSRSLLWGLMLIAAAATGYVIAQAAVPNEADMLARDYDVIRQFDVYQDVDDASFLQELQRDRQLMDQIREQSRMPKPAVSTRLLLAASFVAALALPPLLLRAQPDNWDAIRTEVERLPQADRDRLNRNTDDYQRLSEAERQHYRDLHATLTADARDDRGELQQTLNDYTAWLATTHAYDRQMLLATSDPDLRVAEVKRIVDERNQALDRSRTWRSRIWMWWFGGVPDLTAEELDRVMNVVENRLTLNADDRQKLRDQDGNEKTGVARYFALFGVLKDRNDSLGPVLTSRTDELLAAIPESKQPPDLSEMPPDRRRSLCGAMIIGNVLQEFEQQVRQKGPTEADLRQILTDWPQDADSQRKREELLELEPADFRRELENQFAKNNFSLDVDEVRSMLPPEFWPRRGRGRRGPDDRSGDGPDDRGRRPFFGPDGERRLRDGPGGFRPSFRRDGSPDGRGPDDGPPPDGARGPRPDDARRPPDGERRPPPREEPPPAR